MLPLHEWENFRVCVQFAASFVSFVCECLTSCLFLLFACVQWKDNAQVRLDRKWDFLVYPWKSRKGRREGEEGGVAHAERERERGKD